VLVIALGGFPLQVRAICLEGGCDGPTWCGPLPQRLRVHRESGRQDVRVARAAGAITDKDPTDGHEVLRAAVPGPRAWDDRESSRGASIAGPPEAGAYGRVRHDLLRSGQVGGFDARAAHGLAHAWWRWLIPRGIARDGTDPGEVTGGAGNIAPSRGGRQPCRPRRGHDAAATSV
jgi:hypothetical protein